MTEETPKQSQLRQLAEPFPQALIEERQGASYVPHAVVNQRLLQIVGPFSFSVRKIVRGLAQGFTSNEGNIYPDREDAILGVVCELIVRIDGFMQTISEAGDVGNPAMRSDGENLKMATSDAFKRCCMRTGLGLHLWSKDSYFLDVQLDRDAGVESRSDLDTLNKMRRDE